MTNPNDLPEVKQARRGLMALRLEVPEAVANDLSALVESAIEVVAASEYVRGRDHQIAATADVENAYIRSLKEQLAAVASSGSTGRPSHSTDAHKEVSEPEMYLQKRERTLPNASTASASTGAAHLTNADSLGSGSTGGAPLSREHAVDMIHGARTELSTRFQQACAGWSAAREGVSIADILCAADALIGAHNPLNFSFEEMRGALAEQMKLRADIETLIGQPPEGSHPDEWKPRAETWHQERLNWEAEVGQLRSLSAGADSRVPSESPDA